MSESKSSIPSPKEFLVSVPLYKKTLFAKDVELWWKILDIIYYRGSYDSFCPNCQKDSTFQVIDQRPSPSPRNLQREALMRAQGASPELPPLNTGVHTLRAQCARQSLHTQDFIFYIEAIISKEDKGKTVIAYTLEKIGQQPAYADLHLAKIKHYASVLTKQQLGELSRAIGLASHDVGVGSYVYLRRVFEALIEEAHKIVQHSDNNWNEEAYEQARMKERIGLLQRHLPTFIVEHPEMYSILSKGIHELSEEECLTHFETLRLGIELILDEKLREKEQKNKIDKAKRAIQKAIGEINT